MQTNHSTRVRNLLHAHLRQRIEVPIRAGRDHYGLVHTAYTSAPRVRFTPLPPCTCHNTPLAKLPQAKKPSTLSTVTRHRPFLPSAKQHLLPPPQRPLHLFQAVQPQFHRSAMLAAYIGAPRTQQPSAPHSTPPPSPSTQLQDATFHLHSSQQRSHSSTPQPT